MITLKYLQIKNNTFRYVVYKMKCMTTFWRNVTLSLTTIPSSEEKVFESYNGDMREPTKDARD